MNRMPSNEVPEQGLLCRNPPTAGSTCAASRSASPQEAAGSAGSACALTNEGKRFEQDMLLMPPPMSLPPLTTRTVCTEQPRSMLQQPPLLSGPYPLQGGADQAGAMKAEGGQETARRRRRRNTGDMISPHDQSKFPSTRELWERINKLEEEDCTDPMQPWGYARPKSIKEPYVLDIEWFNSYHLVRARLIQLQDTLNAPGGRRLTLLRTSAVMTDAAQKEFSVRKRVLWGFTRMMDRYRRFLHGQIFFVRTATLILEPIILAKEDYLALQRKVDDYSFCIVKLRRKPDWKENDLDDAGIIRAIMEMDNLIDTDSFMDTHLLDTGSSEVSPNAMAAARMHGQIIEVHPDVAAVRMLAGLLSANAEDPPQGPSPKKERAIVEAVDNVNPAIATVNAPADLHPIWRIN